ncbi:acyl-CoA dehydrogenase family protein [Sandaracinus amylolyticus]|uniref:acyl-CoA dehydrogenase family protein n=1 Tax=Sandaracinus amylolyticus TaxID=927083 RepID=UPI001F34956D|nr:acyl-CoA dehydrogenase family protein [Sandaracinus amylolyticus]
MDFEEREEQRMLREGVRRIATSFGHRWYVERARRGEKTQELWDALAREGYLGVSLPEQYGGGGLGISELCIVCEELSAQGCPLLLLVVSPAICGTVIARFGDDAQRARWLPGLAKGTSTMVFALTEPDAGSNSHQVSTTAVRDGDGWRISGQKYYISGVDEAEQMLLVARTGTDARTGRGQLSLFVVDTDAPGLKRDAIPMEIVSPEKQFTLFFDDVRVPGDRLIGGEGNGLKALFHGLNPERITSAAYCVGLARYALDKGAAYARERKVWSVPIGAHQGIAHPLARACIQMELAKLMTQKAAWLHDAGKDAGEASNMARLSAADAAIDSLDAAIQTHGGNGLASEYGLADLWGFARLQRIAPVSREMVLNFVSQHSLGLPKSY